MKNSRLLNSISMYYKKKIAWKCCLSLLMFASLTLSAQNITYSFDNARIVDDGGTKYYEADIMVSTDADYGLGDAQIYLNYNTAAFGTNIGSGALSVPHPESPYNASSEYLFDHYIFGGAVAGYTLVVNNNTTSRVSIAFIQALATPGQYETVTAAGSPHKLFSIRIAYSDVAEDPMISFDALGEDQTFTTDEGSGPTQITGATLDSNESPPSFLWTGATDSDFNTASNWSSDIVPGSTQKVMIQGGLTTYPTATGNITVDEITVESGASFIAQGTVTGTLTYERTLTTSDWYLVSSPVVGQDEDDFVTSNNLQESSTQVGRFALGTYNTANDEWDYYEGDTGSATLTSGIGYTVNLEASAGDLVYSGTMLTDDLTPINLNIAGGGFNLVGNPYPSYLDSNALLTLSGNSDSLDEQTIWVWDQSANGGAGAYIAKIAVENFQVAPGQGFFVKSDGVAGTLTINEAFQSHQTTDTFLRSSNTRPEIHLTATNGTGEMNTKIYYIEGTTTGFDNGFDGSVFGGSGSDGFNVYTKEVTHDTGNDLAIQSLPPNDYENMVIPIGLNASAGSEITFQLETVDFPSELKIYLEDTLNNTFTQLNETGASYQVTMSSDVNGAGRFYLHTTTSSLSNGGIDVLSDVSLYVNNNTKQLVIQGLEIDEKAQISIYDLTGKLVFSEETIIQQGNNMISINRIASSIYVVQLQTEKGKLDKKIVVE